MRNKAFLRALRVSACHSGRNIARGDAESAEGAEGELRVVLWGNGVANA